MAIGAIQAMKAAGMSMDEVIVGGVDATQDALAAMEAGDLDVTVFQNAAGQGKGAVDAALKLAQGEAVEQKVYIPFQLVTPANLAEFQAHELSRERSGRGGRAAPALEETSVQPTAAPRDRRRPSLISGVRTMADITSTSAGVRRGGGAAHAPGRN